MGIWEGGICGDWGSDGLADAKRRRDLERAGGGKKPAKRVPEGHVADAHENRFGVPTPHGYDPLAGASGLLRKGVKHALDK